MEVPVKGLLGILTRRDRPFLNSLFAGLLLLIMPVLVAAQGKPVRPRITARVDEGRLTVLRGNTHPLARAENDRGAVPDSQPMHRILLLLQRGLDQEAALKQLLDQQQSKAFPNYHQWFTPQQFGQQFGPADADIQAVTDWLRSHGFQVAKVSTGRTLVEFSGTAGQVRNAFHTEIHRYLVNGEQYFANNSDPQIPAALTPVVAGPVSLHNFPKKAQNRTVGVFRKTTATGRVTPLYTFSGPLCGTTDCNAVGPGDFAAIYNVQKLWSPGINGQAIDGTGQTIAIVGDSEICTASSPDFSDPTMCNGMDDVKQFRTLFGLPTTNLPNVILDGPDPYLNSDETEGDLDVEWSGAVAKNATIDFVIAESTEASAGTDLAAEYIVDNNLAPVMSESFSACEPNLGNGGNQFEATLWEQAAAQGITVIVSSGDNGSADCDDPNTQNAAFNFGPAVNGIASTPFNVAAGGTDFDITLPSPGSYQSTYWGATNTTVGGIADVSALSYIPETTWNDSCAQSFTGAVTGCSPPSSLGLLNIVAGSGGQSEFYTKPSWQTVASGSGLNAGNDLTRDLPDISLFSADGFISNSFYIICEADLNPGGVPCDLNTPYFDFVGVGGTSSAAPTFAGMMALVNQEMTILHQTNSQIPTRQGNANYVLYHLATNQSGLSCGSSAGPNSACTFNDVTKGNNSVPCVGGSPGCSNTTNSATYGVLETVNSSNVPTGTAAFNAGTGLDLATGLGSINALNLVTNWGPAVGAFTPTTPTLCLSLTQTASASCAGPISITHGTKVYVNITVNGTHSGTPIPVTETSTIAEDVSLIGTFPGGNPSCNVPGCNTGGVDRFTLSNSNINSDIYPLTNGSFSSATTSNLNYTTSLTGGTYDVVAHYAGDGTFGASDSTPPISVTVNPEGSTAFVSVFTLLANGNVPQTTSASYGDLNLIRVDVQGTTSGQESATGTVTLTDNGAAIVNPTGGTTPLFSLNTEGYLEDQTSFLAVGSHSFQAKYNGDASYSPTSSSPVAFTVTQAPTTTTVTPSVNPVKANTNFTLTAIVDTQSAANPSGGSSGLPPTGMVTFSSGTTQLGTANLSQVSGGDSNGFVESQATLTAQLAATASIAAVYSGDVNYTTSTSPAVTVTVTSGTTPSISLASATNPINISAPGQPGMSIITVSGSNLTSADNVTLTCAVTPTNLSDTPTCSFNTNPVALSNTTTSGQSTLMVSTIRPSALFKPASRPRGPDWFVISEVGAFIACFFLLGIAAKKRRGMVTLAMLLFVVIAVGTGCGGGSSGGGGGNPGTTVGAYTVTVTATPASGTAQTTTITVNVQ